MIDGEEYPIAPGLLRREEGWFRGSEAALAVRHPVGSLQDKSLAGWKGLWELANQWEKQADMQTSEGDVDTDGDMDMDGVGDAGTPVALRIGPSLQIS